MRSLYLQIADKLEALREGAEAPIQLPDEHTLSADLSVARETLRRALRSLEERGIVTRTPRVGTFLQPRIPQSENLKNKIIGVISPWWVDPSTSWYLSVVREGISRWALEHHCELRVLQAAQSPIKNKDGEWFETIRKNELTGIIWIQPQEKQLRLMKLTSSVLPTVSIGRSIKDSKLYEVAPDFGKAAELVDEHLVEMGHKEYAIVGKNVFDPISAAWREGITRAQAKRDKVFNPSSYFIDFNCYNKELLGTLLLNLYKPSHPEVSAFVFISSGYLHAALTTKKFRQRVEQDISVITMNLGYGPYPIEHIWPDRAITRLDCNWGRMGERAANMLGLITEKKAISKLILEPVSLTLGDTVHLGPTINEDMEATESVNEFFPESRP